MTSILYKTSFVHIHLLHNQSVLKLTWLKQPEEDQFQEAFISFLNFARDLKIKDLLSDNRVGINITISQQRWVTDVCVAYFPDLRVKRFARVVPNDAFQQLVTYKMYDSFNEKICNNVDLRIFTELEMATDWLMNSDRFSCLSAAG